MNKYKLLAVDMDGTLLNNNKEIPTNTLLSINKMIEEGLIFCLSTGRPSVGVKKYCEQINGDIPLILYNGALVTTSKSNNIMLECNLKEDVAKKIIDIIEKHNGTYIFWANGLLYFNHANKVTDNYFSISKALPHQIDDNEKIPYGEITKIIWFDEHEKLVEYENTILKDIENVNYFTSQPTFLEFVSAGISKAKALDVLGKYYGIKKEEMIAVGDGENDISMIEEAGLGVAMENASQNVKDKADYVTSSNEDEGVLKIINEFMINRK